MFDKNTIVIGYVSQNYTTMYKILKSLNLQKTKEVVSGKISLCIIFAV